MELQMKTWGGLRCRVVDEIPNGRTTCLVVVLCHGFGAPGTDLVPLAAELTTINASLRGLVRFVFPEAPLSLDSMGIFGGRAWWYLDIERLNAAIVGGEMGNLRNELPEGLPAARQMLTSLIDEVKQETGLNTSRFLLGGFSQGAMLATDVALRQPDAPAGLCVLSGSVLCEDEWRELAAKRGRIPVLQSHGRQDPLLPFEGALLLKDLLSQGGLDVDFVPFVGPHTITEEAIQRLAAMIARLAAPYSKP